MLEIQTDLAVEARESFPGEAGEIEGVVLEKNREAATGICTTKIEILNETGSRMMRKAQGSYYTLEFTDDTKKPELERKVEEILGILLPKEVKTVLVVGLGNAGMTADALGPETAKQVRATRAYLETGEGMAALSPGVMAQTGMESAEIIAGVCRQIKADAVIAIDALAARSSFRLGKTIQLTDTGIQPGSGIGNSRQLMNREMLGVPVIAIGVPTVVSAAAIVCDGVGALEEVFRGHEILGGLEGMQESELKELVLEVMTPKIGNLYVMPKDMDELVVWFGEILSEALNHILQ